MDLLLPTCSTIPIASPFCILPNYILEPIDLTGNTSPSASPHVSLFLKETMPESQPVIDPSFLDPVEYTYSLGPKTIHKFF
jgi:hypothetical protein